MLSGTTTGDLRMDCGGIAETSTGLALAFGADASSGPIAMGGVPITPVVGATSGARGFILRLTDDGTAPSPVELRQVTTLGRLYTEFTAFWPRYQITITEDGAGGTIVTGFGQGPLSGLLDAESLTGTTPTIAIARYDASGSPTWARRFTIPGMLGAHTPRAAVIGSTVYLATEVNVPSGGTTILMGVTGLGTLESTFDVSSLFVLPMALADGTPDAARFRRTPHAGAITDMIAEPSGELVIAGYASGDDTTATMTSVDTFGVPWSVPDQDSGFIAVLDVARLDARWMHPLAGETVMEDAFVGTTEFERATALDVNATGATWTTGKLRTAVASNRIFTTTVTTVGYTARLR